MGWMAVAGAVGSSQGSGGGSLFGNALTNANPSGYMQRAKAQGKSKASGAKNWFLSQLSGNIFNNKENEGAAGGANLGGITELPASFTASACCT